MAYSNEIRLQVQVAIGCGMTVPEAVKAFGISKTTIHCWLNLRRLERQRQAVREWREANPEAAKQAHKTWYNNNLERARKMSSDSMKRWYRENPEKAKIRALKNYKQQYTSNRSLFIEKARRRKNRQNYFPMTKIEKMMCNNYYLMSRELTEQTGIKHEVDHIWPISRGGPHLPWNLRVITAEENRKKGNKI